MTLLSRVVFLLASLSAIEAMSCVARAQEGSVTVAAKDLIAAINNQDIEWTDSARLKWQLPMYRGATSLVVGHCGKGVSWQLVAALDDPSRFVAAHVALTSLTQTCASVKPIWVTDVSYEQLTLTQHRNGQPTIDPAQRTKLKRLWTDRLGPKPDREPLDVKVPTKELIEAINNRDLEWGSSGKLGWKPRITGATLLVAAHCGPEVSVPLISALDDPKRFVAAHVLLATKFPKEQSGTGGYCDHLALELRADGRTIIDPAQRATLKELWIGRLNPKEASELRNIMVPAKDLIAAIHNHDITWDLFPGGLLPDVAGATLLVSRYSGPEVTEQLVSALDDPNRFVAAHVVLSARLLKEVDQTGGNQFDHLLVHLGTPTPIDPAQRTMLKKLWVDRLKPKADGSRDPALRD
jgi:hypothetical protein